VLFTVIVNRLVFHNPLPDKLMSTFFFLIAPPAVGFLAYSGLVGGLDAMGRILYYTALFLTLLLLVELPRFSRLELTLSWWAYSFPMAAITTATLEMYRHTGSALFLYGGMLLLALLVKTVAAVRRHGICVPEG